MRPPSPSLELAGQAGIVVDARSGGRSDHSARPLVLRYPERRVALTGTELPVGAGPKRAGLTDPDSGAQPAAAEDRSETWSFWSARLVALKPYPLNHATRFRLSFRA